MKDSLATFSEFAGTLDEEEMLHPEGNYQDELKMLEDDASLSIDELRKKYCNAVTEEEYDDAQSTSTSDDTRKSEGVDDATVNPDFTEPGNISLCTSVIFCIHGLFLPCH